MTNYIPSTSVTVTDGLYTIAATAFGVLSAIWVTVILPDITSFLPQTVILALFTTIGLVSGFLPWGGLAAHTAQGRVLLIYLTASFLSVVVLVGINLPNYFLLIGAPAILSFVLGGIIKYSDVSTHIIFPNIWVCLLGVYLSTLVLVGLVLYQDGNLLLILVGGGITLLMLAVFQTLVNERKSYINE